MIMIYVFFSIIIDIILIYFLVRKISDNIDLENILEDRLKDLEYISKDLTIAHLKLKKLQLYEHFKSDDEVGETFDIILKTINDINDKYGEKES